MKWFKHDSDAHTDAKLKKVRHKYGMVGYGLYWYCVELIAGRVDKENISFELEEDAEIIALEWNLDQLKVEEIMRYFVELGLFEAKNSTITCLKLAKRLDDTNAKNPLIKQLIARMNQSESEPVGEIPSNSGQTRLDKTRLEKEKPSSSKKLRFTDDDMRCAEFILSGVLSINPNHKKPNLEKWAVDVRLMRESDGRSHKDICQLYKWVNADDFWRTNILSPAKLRKQWDTLTTKKLNPGASHEKSGPTAWKNKPVAERVAAAADW